MKKTIGAGIAGLIITIAAFSLEGAIVGIISLVISAVVGFIIYKIEKPTSTTAPTTPAAEPKKPSPFDHLFLKVAGFTVLMAGAIIGIIWFTAYAFSDSASQPCSKIIDSGIFSSQNGEKETLLFAGTLKPGQIVNLAEVTAFPNRKIDYKIKKISAPIQVRVEKKSPTGWSTITPADLKKYPSWNLHDSGVFQVKASGKTPVEIYIIK